MSGNRNDFSYKGEQEFYDNRMYLYEGIMKDGDVSKHTLYNASMAAQSGNLRALQSQFAGMTHKQKKAVLTTSFDPSDMYPQSAFWSLSSPPFGTPEEVARQRGHMEVAAFLKEQLQSLQKKEEEKSVSCSPGRRG